MRKVKDMTEEELIRTVGRVVRRITNPIESMMKQIAERFTKIETRIQQEIEFPGEYKKWLVQEIRRLDEKLKRFLRYEEEHKS